MKKNGNTKISNNVLNATIHMASAFLLSAFICRPFYCFALHRIAQSNQMTCLSLYVSDCQGLVGSGDRHRCWIFCDYQKFFPDIWNKHSFARHFIENNCSRLVCFIITQLVQYFQRIHRDGVRTIRPYPSCQEKISILLFVFRVSFMKASKTTTDNIRRILALRRDVA